MGEENTTPRVYSDTMDPPVPKKVGILILNLMSQSSMIDGGTGESG